MQSEPCSVTRTQFWSLLPLSDKPPVVHRVLLGKFHLRAPTHPWRSQIMAHIEGAYKMCTSETTSTLYLSISNPYLTAEPFSALTFHDSPRALQAKKWNGLWETAASEWRSLPWEAMAMFSTCLCFTDCAWWCPNIFSELHFPLNTDRQKISLLGVRVLHIFLKKKYSNQCGNWNHMAFEGPVNSSPTDELTRKKMTKKWLGPAYQLLS